MNNILILDERSDLIKNLIGRHVIMVILGPQNGSIVELARQHVGPGRDHRKAIWLRGAEALQDMAGDFLELPKGRKLLGQLREEPCPIRAFCISLSGEITNTLSLEQSFDKESLKWKLEEMFVQAEEKTELAKTTIVMSNSDSITSRLGKQIMLVILSNVDRALVKLAGKVAGKRSDPRWVIWVRSIFGMNNLLDHIGQLKGGLELIQKLKQDPESVQAFAISVGGKVEDVILSNEPIDVLRIELAFSRASKAK